MRIPGRDIGRKENLGNRYKIMIRTWTASIVPLYEEELYRLCDGQVPSFRREKADRMKGKQVRAQSVGVWLLYERMKKEYGIEADTAYNLSHSGDYVLCSVSTERHAKVGCDIEEVKEPNLKIAGRFFCPAEYEQIAGEEDKALQQEYFFRYWVLKESFAKATREGLALGMDTFEIMLGNPSVLVKQPENYPERYHYREAALRGGELVSSESGTCCTESGKYRPEGKEYREDAGGGAYRIAVCSTDSGIEEVRRADFLKLLSVHTG